MIPTQEQIDNLHPELKKIYDAINAEGAKQFRVRVRHMTQILKFADVNSTLFGTLDYETMEYAGYDSEPLPFTVKSYNNLCWVEAMVGPGVRAVVSLYPEVLMLPNQQATLTKEDLDDAFFRLQEQMMQRADTIVASLTP
jgi:hypothetical protein